MEVSRLVGNFPFSNLPFFRLVRPVMLAGIILVSLAARYSTAQSCTTQGEMDASTRTNLENAALSAARLVASDTSSANAKTVRSSIASQVATQADGILTSMASAAPKVQGATFIARNLYILDATDSPANEPASQFFCGSMNQPPHVVFTLGGLQKGKYAITMLEATDIAKPQQMTIIFAQSGPETSWKLAGFSYKSMTMAGHDGAWYWSHARIYSKAKENWNAYFYYATARYLLVPVDFLSSTNLNKMRREEDAVKPAGLPGAQPMVLSSEAQSFSIIDLHTDGSLGGLDLVIRYAAQTVQDPVATRSQNLAVMHLILQAHPELKDAFHGLWVYAVAPGQAPFGIELPMGQIP